MLISDKLKTVLLKDIKIYGNNVKIHTQDQIDRIKKSIEDNSYVQPIAVSKDNEIVIGTGRYLALKQIDPKMEIEVVDVSGLSADKIKKLRIVDNQLSNISDWDKDNLSLELKKIYTDLEDNFEKILDDIGLEEKLIDEMIRADQSDIEKPEKEKPEEKNSKVQHKYICKVCETELVCPRGCQE